ncbi:hypothetical protein MIR68_004419 [Amoeboaphelidium protococcarum]|nr:hypothetical protein MIR68_004419 [Amoeboaphelidium protococcarum]KAI3650659.1 hypothetical protein MP228_004140 [Amoeboaphelidium protococcarum]KAI3654706.1 hypothetical protein MP228_000086 [Amoeboaphelidium protococcarum]
MKAALLSVFAAVASASLSWTSCGTENDILKLGSINFTPENPKKGDVLHVVVTGDLKSEVSAGTKVVTKVKYRGIRIPVPEVDVCKSLGDMPDVPQCPFKSGGFNITQDFPLPSVMPNGKYDVNLVMKDQNQQQVTCLNVKLEV